MKKLLSLILALVLMLSLCACAGGRQSAETTASADETASANSSEPAAETESAAEAEPAAEEKEISGDLLVWLPYEDHAQAFIKAFNEKYPNVNVEYEIIGSLETAEKLSLDGPAGIGADVIWTGADRFNIDDGYIEPFPADVQARIEEVLLDAAVDAKMKDGKMYGLPISLQTVALYYNKDLVETPPETFEEILEFAKTYNDAANGKYALRLMPNSSYTNYFCLTPFGYRWFGENGEDWKNPGFDSPEVAEGLEFFKSLRTAYDVDNADATNDAVYGAFDRGEVPFVINGPWGIASAKAAGVNFGVTKIPTINGKQPYTFAGAQIIAVSSYSKNFDAAFAFAEFFLSNEGAQILYETQGVSTALKDISGVPGLSDDEYLMGFAEQEQYTYPQPVIPEMNLSWQPTMAMMEFVWDGKLTVEEAQAKAMEDYELLLNGNGESMYD